MAVIKDKILVIEDEKSINYLIGTVLTANGYDVIKAYTGTEACQMLDAYCPDLIFWIWGSQIWMEWISSDVFEGGALFQL